MGSSAEQNRMTSVTNRTDGLGGKTYSFWAWYSFKMSFWRVPERAARSTPVRSATPTYMASTGAAGELIVMDVDTFPRSMPSKRVSMSSWVSMATPVRSTSPCCGEGSSESRPRSVGSAVEGRRQPVATGTEQLFEASVRVGRRSEPGELAHRPQAGPVHGGVGGYVRRGTGRATPRRSVRTPVPPEHPTSSRSEPIASASSRIAPAQVSRSATATDYFNVKLVSTRPHLEVAGGTTEVRQQVKQLPDPGR